jgi:hypothetical protein
VHNRRGCGWAQEAPSKRRGSAYEAFAERPEFEAVVLEEPEALLDEPVDCALCPPLLEPEPAEAFSVPEPFPAVSFEESEEPFWLPESDSPERSLARESVR